ncbi:MAG: tRNA pseudouridine synthase tRNA pseudouridine55 synthase [Candidatus Parcubacteria bacterium]|jgi:tRNA pseudouridine55 synthase
MSPILIYKQFSLSPLETIIAYKQSAVGEVNHKMCYAGRLDPMAEGVLVVLAGEDCKDRKMYEDLPKTYEFEIIPGITTDTYDIMGMFTHQLTIDTANRSNDISQYMSSLIGKQKQPYPPFSSARVQGKPLYYWARAGKIDTIQVPHKEIEIYKAEMVGVRKISTQGLLELIIKRVSDTKGKFRQDEILDQWKSVLKDINAELLAYKCRVVCSSGTYIRSIAHEIGQKLGIGAIALGIKRIAVGTYKLEDCIQITDSGTVTTHEA